MHGTISAATHTSSENKVKGKAEKKTGKRIGFYYIILKSLKESQKNDVVKCLYIKGLINFGICVIKEGTYGDSLDKQGRDIKDRLMWQKQLHTALQDKVRVPRLLDSFEENGNYYLVLERIKGRSLGVLCKKHNKELRDALITGSDLGIRFLNYLLQIVDLLETLHQHHIVHRDVTSANFMITPGGKAAIIDLELSYSLQQQFPSPPFQLGTHGYMSPQQEATQTPTIQEDIFSVGAILIQVWTGITPIKLTSGPIEQLVDRIYFFVPDKVFADIILQCLQPDPDKRPALKEVRNVIKGYSNDLQKKNPRQQSSTKLIAKEEIVNTIQQVIGTLASPLLADHQNGWFSENRNAPPNADKNKINKAWYASFNLGGAGILYILAQLQRMGFNVSATEPFIHKALALIEEKYINNIEKIQPGLHFGADGIAACLAYAMHYKLIAPQDIYWDWINRLLTKEASSSGIMYGTAGQGIANLLCSAVGSFHITNERLQYCVQHLLSRQEKDGSWIRSVTEKEKRVTKGFAHGVAGIVYFLLEYAQYYNDKRCLMAAEKGLQWLIKKAVSKNGTVNWLSSTGRELPPWWCEGAPGISLAFLKAYKLLKEPRYKNYAICSLLNHPKNIINNNLSQCHGLSGLGEIYLEAYCILQDPMWLERASWIAQMLMLIKKQHPVHGPYWLVEQERQPVPGFMIGNSGILHFLLRYCYPDKIYFPFISPSEEHRQVKEFSLTQLTSE